MLLSEMYAHLEHHGVKGQKWGVRRTKAQLASPSEDHARTSDIRTQGKTQGTHTLSNAQLKTAIERMNLEQQYSRLNTPKNKTLLDSGKGFAASIVKEVGKNHVRKLLIEGAAALGPALYIMKKKAG